MLRHDSMFKHNLALVVGLVTLGCGGSTSQDSKSQSGGAGGSSAGGAGVPKEPGVCWSDADCGDIPGSCVGGAVCPCAADCFAEDTLGKCVIPDQCCSSNADCVSTPETEAVCVAGNCETKPQAGQCWTDADCAPGTACGGACICPCGVVCACGGQMGWCEGPKPD
jgi:hypothetical protein